MTVIDLPASGWKARPYQFPLWKYLHDGGKRATAIWPRRHGKDALAMNWAACAAFERVGNYLHLLPEQEQARKALWTGVNPHTGRRRIDETFPAELRKNTLQQSMAIEFANGSTWQLAGADNYNSLVGTSYAGIVFSEWALSDPQSWAYLRPMLLENNGWALFITTPRGANHAKTMHDGAMSDPAWFAERLSSEGLGVFTDEQLASERSELIREYGPDLGDAIYRQEYLCSFEGAILGAVYAALLDKAEREKRIGNVPADPARAVWTSWDLGIRDSTAIWFWQVIGPEVRLVDYLEASGQPIAYYASEVFKRDYRYGGHILPHDAEARQLGTGRTIEEQLRAMQLQNIVICPALSDQDETAAARSVIPMCWFDKTKCEHGLAALRQYRRTWDEKAKVLSAKTLHDWSSHGSHAFAYGAALLNRIRRGVPGAEGFGVARPVVANTRFNPHGRR